jgi:hypothetical protein
MEPTIRDIVVWVDDVALSTAQIQKVYDWRITLWGALSNAILTAVFFIIATALVETYKETLKLAHFWSAVGAVALLYCGSYVFCRFKIRQLRREFVVLYTLLLELA